MNLNKKPTILVLLALFTVSCNNPINQLIKPQANNFQNYQQKFQAAYAHYKQPKDSLKLKSLDFIIKNLDDQFYFEGKSLENYEKCIYSTKNKSAEILNNQLDSISLIYGHTYTQIRDDKIIDNAYLIKNIEEAFASWDYKWSKQINFTEFCEYILPYKAGDEMPQYWRQTVKNEFKKLSDSLKNCANLIEVTNRVNHRLFWYKKAVDYDYPVDVGYKLIKEIGIGSCAATTKFTLFPMRALGLPVVIDYAPAWGNRSGGHYWNALIVNGKTFTFQGAEADIGDTKTQFKVVNQMYYKLAKVFRKTYSKQQSSLAENKVNEPIPAIFENKRIRDVTSDYVPVANVELSFKEKIPKNKFAYLCTFDNIDWTPVFWGMKTDDKITFKNMGLDMLYLPTAFQNNNLVPIGNPFILSKKGIVTQIILNNNAKQSLLLTRKYPDDDSNKIEIGDNYELFYWNNAWQSLGTKIATHTNLTYQSVPKNALFVLRDLTKGKQERIFTYENNKQIWW